MLQEQEWGIRDAAIFDRPHCHRFSVIRVKFDGDEGNRQKNVPTIASNVVKGFERRFSDVLKSL